MQYIAVDREDMIVVLVALKLAYKQYPNSVLPFARQTIETIAAQHDIRLVFDDDERIA